MDQVSTCCLQAGDPVTSTALASEPESTSWASLQLPILEEALPLMTSNLN